MERSIIIENIERQGGDKLRDYLDFQARGIEFTYMQLQLMFLGRQYGKTFMSNCIVMQEVMRHTECYISFKTAPIGDIATIIPTDEDTTTHELKVHYINQLEYFIKEFYPEITIESRTREVLKLNKKRDNEN